MTVYAPGTQERDPSKQNMALQDHAKKISDNTTSITALQTPGYGLTYAGGLIVGLTKITASLGADVLLNNIANYFDGPSIAQGTTGTWFVSGTVTVFSSSADNIGAKLWDGTSVLASALTKVAAGFSSTMTLSGVITGPAANLRISCRDFSSTSGSMTFNASGNSKDCSITAVRIA